MINDIKMKRLTFVLLVVAWSFGNVPAQEHGANKSHQQPTDSRVEGAVMSEAYQKFWDPEVQAKIDRNIDLNRKADAVCRFERIINIIARHQPIGTFAHSIPGNTLPVKVNRTFIDHVPALQASTVIINQF